MNATCHDTGQIYVEWKRPDRFDKSVDYYKLYHKPVSDPTFKSVIVPANAKEDTVNVSNKRFFANPIIFYTFKSVCKTPVKGEQYVTALTTLGGC